MMVIQACGAHRSQMKKHPRDRTVDRGAHFSAPIPINFAGQTGGAGIGDQSVVLPPAIPNFVIPGVFHGIHVDLLKAVQQFRAQLRIDVWIGPDGMPNHYECTPARGTVRRTAAAALDEQP